VVPGPKLESSLLEILWELQLVLELVAPRFKKVEITLKSLVYSLSLVVTCVAAAGAQTMNCPATGDKSTRLRTEVIEYVTDSAAADFRADIGLTSLIDTSTIAVVTADSLCDAVTRGINAAAQSSRATAMIVVKFGSFFAACDPSGSMIRAVYILDDHYRVRTIMGGT